MDNSYFPHQPTAALLPLGWGLDDQNFITLTSEAIVTPEGDVLPMEQRVVSYLTARPARDVNHKVNGVVVEALNMSTGGVDRIFIAAREYKAQSFNVREALKILGCKFGAAGLKSVCDLLADFAEMGTANA